MYKDTRSITLGIRVTEDEKRMIEYVTRRKRGTMSYVLRNIILDEIEKEYRELKSKGE